MKTGRRSRGSSCASKRGVALIYAATRATATVDQGRSFIQWMLVVFVCFVLLASLPVVIAF